MFLFFLPQYAVDFFPFFIEIEYFETNKNIQYLKKSSHTHKPEKMVNDTIL